MINEMPEVQFQYWRDNHENLDCWGPTEPYKKDLLRWYGQRYKLRTFIETGTYTGEAIAALKDDFDQLYSIEINPDYYELCSQRFAGRRNVHLYQGDSGKLLERILTTTPDTPTLFWVDAHANNIAPMREELDTIFKYRQYGAVLIDDVQGFWNNDWPQVVEQAGREHPSWKLETIVGIARFTREP